MTKTQQLAFALAYQHIANMVPLEIAEYLRSMNIRGIPDQIHECPLAEYFKWAVPDVTDVAVTMSIIIVAFTEDADLAWNACGEFDCVEANPTEEISSFVERVDQHDYPDLLRRDWIDS